MKHSKTKILASIPVLLASLAVTAPAWAQQQAKEAEKPSQSKVNLDFYGMIDAGVEYVDGTLANGNDSEAIRISNGIITPHFGVKGGSELTKGMRGNFNLEGSFSSDNGTSGIGGRLLGRQAWVGVSGGFGEVRLGRQYTAVRMGWEDANPYGTGNQGLRLLDPRISNPRHDNSISYRTKLGAIDIGASFSPGWDAVDGNSANAGPANAGGANCAGEVPDERTRCKAVAVGVKYKGETWGVAASHEKLNGGVAATFGGLTSPSLSDQRTVVGGFYNLGGGKKLAAGWIGRKNEGSAATPKSNMYWAEAIVPIGSEYSIDGLVAQLKYDNSPNKATLFNVRGRYFLNKETTLYVAVSNISNGGSLNLAATASTPVASPESGGKQTSIITGVVYKF